MINKVFKKQLISKLAAIVMTFTLCIIAFGNEADKSSNAPDNRDSFIAVGSAIRGDSAFCKKQLYLLFGMTSSAIKFFNMEFLYGDKVIRCNPHWVRDHILILKSGRYLYNDTSSFVNLLLDEQHPDGFFYEILAPYPGDPHAGWIVSPDNREAHTTDAEGRDMYVVNGKDPKFAKISRDKGFGLCRLELEADIEYLMVEGVYLIWQANGDTEFLKNSLPKLEKGLNYIMTDPSRWDKKYQLAKRPRTIDTWDFTDNPRSGMDRTIHSDDPMGIMHGDNTGLYQAEILLAKMFRVIGESEKAQHWEKLASELRERINKHLWNGEFYKHYIALDTVNYGVDDATQLSLSNAYDINRGVSTPEMTRSVINRYRSMRNKYKGDFDDFRTLDPAYPKFKGIPAGKYLNGTIGPFVAGQLAVAAFENGMEEYGADILDRFATRIKTDGKIAFLYDLQGKDIGGGPRAWSGAEILNAFIVGLAGVKDNYALFEDVTISPRWVAAKENKAHVFIKYPTSDRSLEYTFKHDLQNKRIEFKLLSTHKNARIRILLPKGVYSPKLIITDKKALFKIEDIFGSKYLCVENPPSKEILDISYETP